MQTLMKQLNLDHRRFLRLFSCVQHQLDLYRGGNWLLPDPGLILNVLDYMQAYPEFWHHPSEDILFAELLERDIPQSYTVESLLIEHQELESATRYIKSAYRDSIESDCLPSEQLIDDTYEYLDRQISHLSTEKTAIYPVVDVYLSDQVVKNLNLTHKEIKDPLFGSQLEGKYDGLFQKIRETDQQMQRDGFSFV